MANTDSGVRIVSPRLDELAKLRQPLTRGERAVLDLFVRRLHPDWEIYVQPHLNGLRPDFVLLNPNVGIGVFEVKDWDLDAMSYWNEPSRSSGDQGSKHVLRWAQREPGANATATCVEEVLLMMKRTGQDGLANADICILTDDQKVGAEIVRLLQEKNISAVTTFDDRGFESKRSKMGFWMGDARVKVTTLHSFKGWESRLLIVHISRAFAVEARALIYAGLTTLKRSVEGSCLTVVSTAPELSNFGRRWPEQG